MCLQKHIFEHPVVDSRIYGSTYYTPPSIIGPLCSRVEMRTWVDDSFMRRVQSLAGAKKAKGVFEGRFRPKGLKK